MPFEIEECFAGGTQLAQSKPYLPETAAAPSVTRSTSCDPEPCSGPRRSGT